MKTILLAIAVMLGLIGNGLAAEMSFNLLGMETPAPPVVSAVAEKPIGYDEAYKLALDTRRGLIVCRQFDLAEMVAESDKYVVVKVADDDTRFPTGITRYRLTLVKEKTELIKEADGKPSPKTSSPMKTQYRCTSEGCFPVEVGSTVPRQTMSYGSSCSGGNCGSTTRWRWKK